MVSTRSGRTACPVRLTGEIPAPRSAVLAPGRAGSAPERISIDDDAHLHDEVAHA